MHGVQSMKMALEYCSCRMLYNIHNTNVSFRPCIPQNEVNNISAEIGQEMFK